MIRITKTQKILLIQQRIEKEGGRGGVVRFEKVTVKPIFNGTYPLSNSFYLLPHDTFTFSITPSRDT